MSSTSDQPHSSIAALGDQLIRLQRRRTSVYAGSRLEDSAFRILWTLSDGEPRTLRQLASDLGLEQSTVNRQVNAALAAGYVERFEVPGSASKLVRPTPVGAEAYEHDGAIRAALITRVLEALGDERAARLIDDLTSFNDAWDDALR
ncbi:MAG: MarR family winged helix-turn-helix transcriptional regulator [Nocardioides sp.]